MASLRIYTRTGDEGSTGLFGGGRVAKSDQRVEAYGAVDELNAVLGLARAACGEQHQDLAAVLARVQDELLHLGAVLADPRVRPGEGGQPSRIGQGQVKRLEADIDGLEAQLEPLRSFILPGGSELAARLHLARTVARRAERRAVALAASHPLQPEPLRYLNRLSDLLFVMARAANRADGVEDIRWEGGA